MNKADTDIFLSAPFPVPVQEFENPNEKLRRLTAENRQLQLLLAIEKSINGKATEQINTLSKQIDEQTKSNTRQEKTNSNPAFKTAYSEYKSDGKRKARPADPIRSYEDFTAIQNYFLKQGNIRNWMLWTVGVALGLRISDLLSIKIRFLLNEDLTFRKRISVIEQKTSKLNDCLITEAVANAVTRYFDSIDWSFTLDDYLFKSRKTKGKMYEEYGWKILSDAGKALNLPIIVGSHTMRKSFANIAACADKSSVDMNVITKIQGLLNHSDQKVTMRYLGTFREMYDRARIAVSDFILGRTDIHKLIVGNNYTLDDIVSKLDMIEISIKNQNR